MPTRFESQLNIALPAEKVWAALTDFASFAEWNPMVREAHGQLVVGRSLSLHLRKIPRPVKAKVRRVEPNRELRWGGGVPVLLDVEHYFRIEPSGDGVLFVHGEIFKGLLGGLIPRLARLSDEVYADYNRKLAEHAATL